MWLKACKDLLGVVVPFMRIGSLSDALPSQLISLGNRNAHSPSPGPGTWHWYGDKRKITSIADGLFWSYHCIKSSHADRLERRCGLEMTKCLNFRVLPKGGFPPRINLPQFRLASGCYCSRRRITKTRLNI